MRLGIMQPYFLPYIGYFQLIAAVDLFIVYDNIKYTKKGWINRNRMLSNGADSVFSLPLKADSDALDVRERSLAPAFDRARFLQKFAGAYQKAPHFRTTYALLEEVVHCDADNLFEFIHHSLRATCRHLGIGTEFRVSSTVPIDHQLRGQDKVIALCHAVDAQTYVNPIGGVELYTKDAFGRGGIDLHFIRSRPVEYEQFGQPFVPWLSIVDVLMFNSPRETLARIQTDFDLI
jgi:hypothetical protein